MDNVEFIKKMSSMQIDTKKMREECIVKASEKRMSCGNKSYVFYGMYPPDIKIYRMFCSKNYGHLTKKEEIAENKYYFNQEGKVIFMERYNPHPMNSDRPYLINCVFYFYYEKEIHIVATQSDTNRITFAAKFEYCDGILMNYIQADIISHNSFGYSEMEFQYNEETMIIKYYPDNTDTSPTRFFRKYLWDGKKIKNISND